MNRIKNNIIIGMLLTVCTIGTISSCTFKDIDMLADDWTKQSIKVDWNYNNIDSIPKSFRIAMWPSDQNTLDKVPNGFLLFDVYNNRAILNDVPSGNFKITAWNTDTENVLVSNIKERQKLSAETTIFYAHQSRTDPAYVLDSLYYGQQIYNVPEYMVHANVESFHVEQDSLLQPICLTPDSMCVTIHYLIHGISGLKLATQVKCAMNNMSKRRFLAYDNLTEDTCVVITDCKRNIAENQLSGCFYIFGMEPSDFQEKEHTMTLFFWLEHNNVFFSIDVNEYLLPYTKEDKHIYLEIPDIKLDLYNYAGSGAFDIDVNEWGDVEKDIKW